ncbi:MAG: hypothetical protein ACK40E_00555 [Caldimicrobium sp.]
MKKVAEEHVKEYVREFVAEFVRENELRARELALIERVVRVEEELKALRQLSIAQFEAIEKRFEALQREMNARFEALLREMDKRFEFFKWFIGIGFTILILLISFLAFKQTLNPCKVKPID